MAQYCIVCDTRTTHTISAPADTGPFMAVEYSTEFRPTDRWDMPCCHACAPGQVNIVKCNSCHAVLPRIDATGGFGVYLCRPCKSRIP